MSDAVDANRSDESNGRGGRGTAARRITRGIRTGVIARGEDLTDSGADRTTRCLILGYDRTEGARRAAGWAASRLPSDGRLVIVHADRPLHAPELPTASVEERRRLGRALIDELMLEGPNSLFDIDVEAEVSDQDPVSALTSAARRHDAEAIVIGHSRHSRLHHAVGTVTTALLDASQVPVWIVAGEGEGE
jgi:nucleotide-binding universal stress UspA family protein